MQSFRQVIDTIIQEGLSSVMNALVKRALLVIVAGEDTGCSVILICS